MTAQIRELATQIIARYVAAGVELARTLGHAMPRDFAVGVRFIEDGHCTRVRMRLDDAEHDAVVLLPRLDGQMSLASVDAMWKRAWDKIHVDAIVLAQVWLDKHPEARVGKDGAKKAVALLDVLASDDDLQECWLEACRERAKHFSYR